MTSNAAYQSILNDLNRDVARKAPDDIVQFCADWFQDKLKQERSGLKSSASSSRRGTPGNAGPFSNEFSRDHQPGSTSPHSEMGPTDGPFSAPRAAAVAAGAGGFAAGAAGATAAASPLFSSPFGGSSAPSSGPADDSSPFSENAPPVGVDFGASPFGPGAQTPSAPVGKGLVTDHDSDDDHPIPQYALGRRTSVSAESLMPAHAKPFDSDLNSFPEEDEDEGPAAMPVFQKTPEQLKRIRDAIKDNFLFKNLDEEQEADVLNAMKEVNIPADDMIIKQGDAGDYFYIVEKGVLDIYVKRDGDDEGAGDKPGLGKKVAQSKEGNSFGELALMHNAPRAATIISQTPCTLWALDRVSFRTILLDHTSRKRRLYESFLSTVQILGSLKTSERAKIADVLESRTFEAGDEIIRQGDEGDEFFLIESGTAEAIKNGVVVKQMGRGDYFGELALLTKSTRAATVRATEKMRVAALGEQAFTRLLGPAKDIMARSAGERYGS